MNVVDHGLAAAALAPAHGVRLTASWIDGELESVVRQLHGRTRAGLDAEQAASPFPAACAP